MAYRSACLHWMPRCERYERMPTPSDSSLSIIIATRNRPDRLERCLCSIARQSYRQFQAIVVDDGSDAATLAQYESLWRKLDERFLLIPPHSPGAPGTGPGN